MTRRKKIEKICAELIDHGYQDTQKGMRISNVGLGCRDFFRVKVVEIERIFK